MAKAKVKDTEILYKAEERLVKKAKKGFEEEWAANLDADAYKSGVAGFFGVEERDIEGSTPVANYEDFVEDAKKNPKPYVDKAKRKLDEVEKKHRWARKYAAAFGLEL